MVDDDTKLGDLDLSDQGEPDDADGDDGDPDDVSAMDDDMMLVSTEASCENCAHKDVCAVYGNFRQQVAEEIPQRTGGEPAFEPDDLAMICDHYLEVDA